MIVNFFILIYVFPMLGTLLAANYFNQTELYKYSFYPLMNIVSFLFFLMILTDDIIDVIVKHIEGRK
jgi:hypothetical protein